MNIVWYPGHIAKARREIKEHLKDIDIVIEVIDARCPLSSIDFLSEEIKNKKRLLVVNKIDLVEKNDLKSFEKVLYDEYNFDGEIVYLDSRDNNIKKYIDKKIDKIATDIYEKKSKRGIKDYKLKAMVVGAPNVGKSTFINSYLKRKVAKVENTPGVTKKLAWTKVNDKVLLMDTPGVTIKKFVDNDSGINLALIGSINDDILIKQDLVYEFLKKCFHNYKNLFAKRYKLKLTDNDCDIISVYDEIARNNGYIKKDGSIDYDRTANLVLNDFRKGRIGKIFLE